MTKWISITGLGFGEEGKTTTLEWLLSLKNPNLVVKLNGGPSYSWSYPDKDGTLIHSYSQFSPAVRYNISTLLSNLCHVDPIKLHKEAVDLKSHFDLNFDPIETLFVSDRAKLLLPIHTQVTKELNVAEACNTALSGISSYRLLCNKGAPSLYISDLFNGEFKEKVQTLRNFAMSYLKEPPEKNNTIDHWINNLHAELLECLNGAQIVNALIEKSLLQSTLVYLEGSGGVLLDRTTGFYPYVSSRPNTNNVLVNLRSFADKVSSVYRLGVLRTYHTRHGNGPLISEQVNCPDYRIDNPHRANAWQGPIRVGNFEWPLYMHARSHFPVSGIMMTHFDHVENSLFCENYQIDDLNIWTQIPFPQSLSLDVIHNQVTKPMLSYKAKPIYSYNNLLDFLTAVDDNKTFGKQISPLAGVSWGSNVNSKAFIGDELMKYLGI